MTGIERQALLDAAALHLPRVLDPLTLLLEDARVEEDGLMDMWQQCPDRDERERLMILHQAAIIRLHDLNTSIAALRRVAEMRACS